MLKKMQRGQSIWAEVLTGKSDLAEMRHTIGKANSQKQRKCYLVFSLYSKCSYHGSNKQFWGLSSSTDIQTPFELPSSSIAISVPRGTG